jgi:hypothetical protein
MTSKRWAWIAATAVLFAGITNAHAHLHLCFDGQDAPAAVHLVDSDAHPLQAHHDHDDDADHHERGLAHDVDGDHDDIDVDINSQALSKASKHDHAAIDAPFVGRLVIGARDSSAQPRSTAPSELPAPPYLHPPLRGPPR